MRNCKTCRWVIATILDCPPTKTPRIITETLICMPYRQEPHQTALGVCECWQREVGADSIADVYGMEEDLQLD